MFFWKKSRAQQIHDDLDSIVKDIKKLKDYEDKKDKTKKIIKKAIYRIENAKDDILGNAKEEKKKPWIDESFDSQIDALARKEGPELDRLRNNLKKYEELVSDSKNHEDIDVAIDFIEEEVKAIKKREDQNEKIVNEFGVLTIKRRTAAASETPPPMRTRDGFHWSKICEVARELGGRVENTGVGDHPWKIFFGEDKISMSSDLGLGRFAGQMIGLLKNTLPEHKIPKKSKLIKALKKGDVKST